MEQKAATVQFEVKLGTKKFVINQPISSNIDFFKTLAFYSSLPETGPNGETDLVLQVRYTKEGYMYLSVVSKQAGQELVIGQSQQRPGECFVKDWQPLYNAESANNNQADLLGQQTAPPAQPQPQMMPQNVAQPAAPAAQPQAQAPVAQPENQAQVEQAANDILSEFGIS